MMFDLPTPSAVLFDWDNTVVESMSFIERVFSRVVADYYGLEEEYNNGYMLAQSARDLFPRVFGADIDKAQKKFYSYFEEDHLKYLNPYPYVLDVINLLHQKGIKLGIVSNKKSHYLKKEVRYLNIEDSFMCIMGSGDSKYDKPDPRLAYEILERMDLKPSEHIWFVGDSDIDVEFARRALLTPIHFSSGINHVFVDKTVQKINCYDLFFKYISDYV